MSSLAVALPLRLSEADGFVMIKGFRRLVKQNLKMLILTIPGERVMEPEYGIGMKKYLFSSFHQNLYADLENNIRRQVKIYMPAVKIEGVLFNASDPDNQTLGITIRYSIPQISIDDTLQFTI